MNVKRKSGIFGKMKQEPESSKETDEIIAEDIAKTSMSTPVVEMDPEAPAG